MKKIIGWPLMHACYWSGDALSRIMYWRLGHLYPVYNWLMVRSLELNDWADLGWWKKLP